MKKTIAFVLIIFALFSFAGWQIYKSVNPNPKPTNSPTEETTIPETDLTTEPSTIAPSADEDLDLLAMIDQIYEVEPIDFEVINTEVDLSDNDNVKYFTGLDNAAKIKKAVASEGAIMPSAYSLVLVQVESTAEAAEVAEEMLKGIDPFKWICVGAEDLQVVAQGDLIMLFMTSGEALQTSDDFIAAFTEIRGETDLELKK